MTEISPATDQETFELFKSELFTAVVGDVLDNQGLHHQFLPPEIKPLSPEMVLIGRAMTVLEVDVYMDTTLEGNGPLSDRPFGIMFEALDSLQPGEVYIASGTSRPFALWGELMTSRARKLGASGAVLDGYSRDTKGVIAQGFPTFSCGTYAQDQAVRGKVIDYRVPIEIGNVRIETGDLIFGDRDGVVVIPRAVEKKTIENALEKVRGETKVAAAIENGMSTVEAFETFGIM